MQNQEEKTKRFQELRSLVNSAITQIEADAAKESSTEEE